MPDRDHSKDTNLGNAMRKMADQGHKCAEELYERAAAFENAADDHTGRNATRETYRNFQTRWAEARQCYARCSAMLLKKD